MIAKPYMTAEHSAILASWWEARQWQPVPASALSETGFIAYDGETPLAYVCLYHDPTSYIAWTEWLVTNPANSPRQSLDAIACVTSAAIDYARHLGTIKHLMTACAQESLSRTYQALGFLVTDQRMIHHFLHL